MQRVRTRLMLTSLGLLALVFSHHLVFFLAHDAAPHESAAAAGGHREYWLPFALSVLVITAAMGVTALIQLRRLNRSFPSNGRESRAALTALTTTVVRTWRYVVVQAAVLFLTQENLEHLAAGGPAPGLSALWGPDYGPAILVIAGVSLVVAAVAGLVQWRYEQLAKHANRSLDTSRRAVAHRRPRVPDLGVPEFLLGRCTAGRAPPLFLQG